MNKLELIKQSTFQNMPQMTIHDWNDMLESDGYITFLKSIEQAMDKHLLAHYYRLSEFINDNFAQKVNSNDDWIDLNKGIVVSSESVLIAYNKHITQSIRSEKHFEDDGAYAD
jgi:hypothetical protein